MSETATWGMAAIALYGVLSVFAVLRSRRSEAEPNGVYATVALIGMIALWWTPLAVSVHGFPAAYLALAAVSFAIFMALFQKRLWIVARSAADNRIPILLGAYFQSNGVKLATTGLGLIAGVTLIALGLRQAGTLGAVLSGSSRVLPLATMVGFGAVLYLRVMVSGQTRDGSAWLAAVQGLTVIGALLIVGVGGIEAAGGWEAFAKAIETTAVREGYWGTTGGRGGGDFSAFLAVPGAFGHGSGAEMFVSGESPWTAMMILSVQVLLLGLLFSPAGLRLMTSMRPPVAGTVTGWMAFAGGGAMIVLSTAFGVSMSLGSGVLDWPLSFRANDVETDWVLILWSLATLAALHAFAEATLSGLGRRRKVRQPGWLRLGAVEWTLIAAAVLSGLSINVLTALAALALALMVQILPSLTGLCWMPWLTRRGILAGLSVGVLAVLLTDLTGGLLQTMTLGGAVWSAFPETIHSAGWGLAANIAVTVVVSAVTQNPAARQHRLERHRILIEHAGIPAETRGLVPVAWIFTVAWFAFALGPGALAGNDVFGNPDLGVRGWNFGIPSIWAWQIGFWVLGVMLVRFLALRMELATRPEGTVSSAEGTNDDG